MNSEKFIIHGGKQLFGSIDVPKAKNSYLAILAGCVLCNGIVTLNDCPEFDDINQMLKILQCLGAKTSRTGKVLNIDCRFIFSYFVPSEIASKIRSSIFLLGPIVSRLKKAVVSFPGGCNIGARPIDLHLKGLSKLGVNIKEKPDFIECEATSLKGAQIHLDYPSVGATENIMMGAVLAQGTTKIYGCAKEPEIVDLQNFLNSMGGKIWGAGTDLITIEGVNKLHSTEFTPIADRIVAGTYLIATATCGGDVTIKNVEYEHNFLLIKKLRQSGLQVETNSDSIRILATGRPKTFSHIETLPYPGFPTDLQAQALVLQTVSSGSCVVVENLFETRFQHVKELLKMGANIVLKDRMAKVFGVENLFGAQVASTDLRAGAALTIAGLVAQGQTTVQNIHYIDRGYEHLENAFAMLGADIKRTKD